MEIEREGSPVVEAMDEREDDCQRRKEKVVEGEEKSSVLQQEIERMLRGGEFESDNNEKSAEDAFDAENAQRTASRLLQLACKFDSTTSLSSLLERMPLDTLDDDGHTILHYAAEEHSVRCIELLLKRRAKTDIKSKKGLVPLESALQSERMQILRWSPADKITDLLTLTCDKDLTAIKILASNTRNLVEIASRLIVHGNIVAFAALLAVSGDTITSTPVQNNEEHGDGTLLDVIVKRAVSLGEEVQDGDGKNGGFSDQTHMLRQMLLRELDLLLRWQLDNGQSSEFRHRTPPTNSVPSPLMRAVQAVDVAVASMLLDYHVGVNETDADGNTALHWCLRATSNTRDTRLVSKFVRSGASITAGNRLGLTPVHIAAGQGHTQALQILLAVEPSSVNATAETRETPLFSAVKGNHFDCVRLLLQHGASRQVWNLRKQRPIDVADTSDMRALLSLQEPSGKVKNLSLIRSTGMSAFEVDNVTYESENLNSKNEIYQLIDSSDESSKALVPAKSEICRYFGMPGGCVRGEKCFYAHGEEDLQGRPRISPGDVKLSASNNAAPPARLVKRVSEDLSKKIFVGGLSPSVESDDLREFFEDKFGPVMDAIVIGSHSGDQVQSRGFGFVTFKHEDSVIAAVQAHYVNIFGKKVEIKGAVPRSGLSQLEGAKGINSGVSRPQSAGSTEPLEGSNSKLFDLSSLELLCRAKSDVQAQWMKFMGYQGEGTFSFPLSMSEEPIIAKPAPPSASPISPVTNSACNAWVTKFKQWLPTFLAEVSNRLKDGEWYPLSSLKGDFRATCGLELDHTGIGYHKLSDFIRSLPDLCRMKIVPVGRGPATHMVLLPALARITPVAPPQVQAPKVSGSIAGRSLVDAGRSYAAAACHGHANIVNVNADCSVTSANALSEVRTLRHSASQSSSVFGEPQISKSQEQLPLPDNLLALGQASVDQASMENGLRGSCPPGFPMTLNLPTEEVDINYLKELLALLDNCEGQQSRVSVDDERATHLIGNRFEACASNASNACSNKSAEINCSEVFINNAEVYTANASGHCFQEEPKTPVKQVSLKPFSTFNHPFTGFLPNETTSTIYSMWGRNAPNNQTNLGSSAQPCVTQKTLQQGWLWDDSPQNVLYPYGRGYPQVPTEERPLGLFHPAIRNPNQDRHLGATCAFCCERPSLWMAVPCNHYALCAMCKEALQKLNRTASHCPVCQCIVERWCKNLYVANSAKDNHENCSLSEGSGTQREPAGCCN